MNEKKRVVTDNGSSYKCNCGKEYKHMASLCKHKKKCNFKEDDENKDRSGLLLTNEIVMKLIEQNTELQKPKEIPMGSMVTNEMFMKLLEQHKELQKQIIELSKHSGTVNNNNNNITNNNNQFNLNLFLNETCKDALNIDDFMDSIKLSVSDLEETGRLGFVEGITRIFLQGLRNLDITQRPFHCTDVKRETVYVKDQNKWEKETAEKTKMKQALNQAVRKNLGMITSWREEHPDYLRSNTKDNDDYIKISLNSLGSEYDDEQKRMDEKIIRNVLKEIVLDKKSCIE
jgi:hypothetical protein